LSNDTPYISVVIASVNGRPYILECLDHLTSQRGAIPFEVLVVDTSDSDTRQEIRDRFPQSEVQLVEVDGRPTIPKLRAMGMERSRGRMVAILEDHCNVPPDWFEVIRRTHEAGHQAIGGAVVNGATDRLLDWAVFFCEYASFLRPMPTGAVPYIAGSSAIYDREIIEPVEPEYYEEVWEYFMHLRMKEQGVEFYCAPDLWVEHKKFFGFWYFMSQRYHYSRSFAGMRMAHDGLPKRVLYAGAAVVLLPPLLLWRTFRTVWARPAYRGKLLKTLPALMLFYVSYGIGESFGALFGPGESLARVE
jgi:GT2 family glycosyltransferase